jgi:hypothetical protein
MIDQLKSALVKWAIIGGAVIIIGGGIYIAGQRDADARHERARLEARIAQQKLDLEISTAAARDAHAAMTRLANEREKDLATLDDLLAARPGSNRCRISPDDLRMLNNLLEPGPRPAARP